MKKNVSFLLVCILLVSMAAVASADSSTNYIDYSITILGGGNGGVDSTTLKKFITGDAVVRLRKLYRQDTSGGPFVETSGYGWAEAWRDSPHQIATSTSGTVNKVVTENARTYIPYLSGRGVVGEYYTFRMRVPSDYNANKQFRYTGSWSPDI